MEVPYAIDSDGAPARELPVGQTETTRRYLVQAAKRGFRPRLLAVDDEALGLGGYLQMAYEYGLMEPRGPVADPDDS